MRKGAAHPGRLVYRLGREGAEEHSIEIILKDGKLVLALTSLDATRGAKGLSGTK